MVIAAAEAVSKIMRPSLAVYSVCTFLLVILSKSIAGEILLLILLAVVFVFVLNTINLYHLKL